jgi:hypothetical protein
MRQTLGTILVVATVLAPRPALANPEPGAYDTRSIGMGLTGVSFLERPAALVLNPANLEGIDKFGFTFNMTNLLVNTTSPVQGPNTAVSTGISYGPLPAFFVGGRIAPRVVMLGGLYGETGYGASCSNVVCFDGDPVVDGVPDTNPATCTNSQPEDLDVAFFIAEFAAGTSIRIHDKFWLGVALRLPFSVQIADLYQNTLAAIGGFGYSRVKNTLGGVGFPTPRIGITIKPHENVSIGVMYRMYSRIKLRGSTEADFFGMQVKFDARSEWTIPNALEMEISWRPADAWLLAFAARLQFHGAARTGNQNQTVNVTDPEGNIPDFATVIPFGWRNVWALKLGTEYRATELIAVRGGIDMTRSATTKEWAQYFTPPPGLGGSVTAGLGFYWPGKGVADRYALDIAGAYAFVRGDISDDFAANNSPATIPGTDISQDLCSREQVIRTACAGDYKVNTFWISLGFTLQY